MNRSFHPDCWPTWLEQVEDLLTYKVERQADMDALYEVYLRDEAPPAGVALMIALALTRRFA